MKTCPRCHTELPTEARFCYQCGAPQLPPPPPPGLRGPRIDWSLPLIPQFNDFFLQQFRERVTKRHDNRLAEYQERLYTTEFRETAYRRLETLALEAEQMRAGLDWEAEHALRVLEHTAADLLDFFFVHHCGDLNRIALPKAILRFQDARRWSEVDPYRLVLDYLDLESSGATVYTDFVTMPDHKLQNAGRAFLHAARDERVLFIVDQSLLGSGKVGYALTDAGLYWKSLLQPAHAVLYTELMHLDLDGDHLLINRTFFDAGRAINLRMLMLLEKIQRLMRG